MKSKSIYALNLFNITSKREYLSYLKRSGEEVTTHNGKVIAIGKFKESLKGDLSPRKVMILVEWESKEAFENYINDPLLKEVHAHRENGSSDYIWQSFEKLEDFRPFFRD